MSRKNSQNWTSGQAITADRLNHFNQDIDDIYALWSDRMRIYRLSTDPALQVRIGAGAWRVWDTEGLYVGGTITIANNTTTYVMIDIAGNIQTSTSAWNPQYTRLAIVVASGWVITSITLHKNDAVGGLLSGKGIPDMRDSAIGTPWSYATQTVVWPEFRPQSVNAWALNIPSMTGVVAWWTLFTYWNWTWSWAGIHTSQIAYSNSTTNGESYIFMRVGASDSTWGTWRKIYPLDGNYLDMTSVPEIANLGIYDWFMLDRFSWDNAKITFESLTKEIIKRIWVANSQSYFASSKGWTSPANHCPNGAIATAQISGIYNSWSAHPNPLIQISPDNSTWSTLMTLVPWDTGNPVGSCIVPPWYVRYTCGNNWYNANHSFTLQIF